MAIGLYKEAMSLPVLGDGVVAGKVHECVHVGWLLRVHALGG